LLASPQNYHYFTHYAELLYSAGKLVEAANYYSLSLELNVDENIRALYGLVLVLSTMKKSDATAERASALRSSLIRLESIISLKSTSLQVEVLNAVLAKLHSSS